MNGRKTITVMVLICMVMSGWYALTSTGGANGEWKLQISFEPDRMLNFDPSVGQDQNNTRSDIVVKGDTVFVVWQDDRNGTWDIISRTSRNGGSSFGPEVRVDDTGRTSTMLDDISDQTDPRAVIDEEGNIYVVWVDTREGRKMLYVGVSTDSGSSFGASNIVDDSPQGYQDLPDIASSGDEVYIVWQDSRNSISTKVHQILLTRTRDGLYFDTPVQVSDAASTVNCQYPTVAASGQMVHVAWTDDRTFDLDVYVSTSSDEGVNFGSSSRISRDPSSSDQLMPDISCNSTHVLCAFTDMRYTSADIFLAVSTDSGATYGTEFILNAENSKGGQVEARTSLNRQGNLSVIWTSSPGFYDSRSDIQALVYMPNGSIGMIATVNDPVASTAQGDPSVALDDDGTIHAVWTDYRRPRASNPLDVQPDIFYTRSTESGEEGKGPVLDDYRVSPEVGKVGDRYTFTVRYSDVEGDAPESGYPRLYLYFRSANDQLFNYPQMPFKMNLRLIPPPDYDYRNGEYFVYSIVIEKGLDLYYRIGARAKTGNTTEVLTPLLHKPVIDITPPTFEKIAPADGEWGNSNLVEFTMRINDSQSGVDPYSVGFQVFRPEQGIWTNWQSRGTYRYDENGDLIYKANITVDNGRDNRVIFRAKDMVGNGGEDYPYSLSDEYFVWVDTTGPSIEIVNPRSGAVLLEPKVNVEVIVMDPGSGVDPDSIRVSYKLDGSTGYSQWLDLSNFAGTEVLTQVGGYFVSFDIQVAYGAFNFIRISANDLMGNTMTSGEVQMIIRRDEPVIIDRPPSPVGSVQPRLTGSLRPHITWTESVDPDGDVVNYRFRVLEVGAEEPFLDWITLGSGSTYWDPPEEMFFEAGKDYTIEIVPFSNELEGPLTRSILTVSADANMPPSAVADMTPKATGESNPVLRWTPSSDPEGDPVYYFIRIWKDAEGSDVVPWTVVSGSNVFRVPTALFAGVYHVNILSSDGIDFSPMSSFLLSIGVFSPKVTPQRNIIVVYQDSSVSINLTIENKGFFFDSIDISLDGEVMDDPDLELILGRSTVELVAGGTTNVTLSVRTSKDAILGYRGLNVTVISGDGVSSYSKPLSIRIAKEGEIVGPGEDGDGDEPRDDTLIYVLVAILVVIILGLAYAFITLDRRQREEQVELIKHGGSLGDTKKERLPKKHSTSKEIGSGRKRSKRNLPP